MPRHIPTSQHSITVFVLTVFLQDYISCSSLLYSNICNYFQCFTMSKIPVQGLLVDICFYTVNCIPGDAHLYWKSSSGTLPSSSPLSSPSPRQVFHSWKRTLKANTGTSPDQLISADAACIREPGRHIMAVSKVLLFRVLLASSYKALWGAQGHSQLP